MKKFVYQKSPLLVILSVSIMLFLVASAFGWLYDNFLKAYDINWFKQPMDNPDLSILFKFFLACIIAPILETFMHQYIPIVGLLKFNFFRQKSQIVIFISALTFGLIHIYSLFYALETFFIGLVLAYLFFWYQESKKFSPFWAVTLIHALYNFYIFLGELS